MSRARGLPRGKFDGVDTAELFNDELPRRDKIERQRAPKPLGYARCVVCTAERVALMRTSDHIVWREHELTTWSGARLPCRSSGVALCALPARSEPGVPLWRCACSPHG